MTRKKIKLNKNGAALIIAFMVVVLLTILSSGLILRSVSERAVAQRYVDSTRAFWLAEAGINQALLQLKSDFNNLNGIAATALGEGEYAVDAIVVEGSNRRVTAHGFIPNQAAKRSERSISVLVQNLPGGNPSNPSLITYAIETSGTLKITGSIELHPSGSSHSGSALTFEEVFGMTPEQVKSIALIAEADGTGHVYTDPAANQQPVNGITWVELTGGNKYSISSNWSGSGLLIVNSNGNDVALDISGEWQFTGMIWVNGRVKVTGTPIIEGAVFARSSINAESTFAGNASLTFDSSDVADAFGFLSQSGAGIRVLSWREI